MNYQELEEKIKAGAGIIPELYSDVGAARARLLRLLHLFGEKYGRHGELMLLSVPGRTELIGNHTDHNGGVAVAGAITRDIVAIARREDDGVVRVQSEGRREDVIPVEAALAVDNYRRQCSAALIAGVIGGFAKRGYPVGGFSAYTVTEVFSGSGLSSSAAFECMIGNILNHLYSGGAVDNSEIAKIGQYAENVYYGKPSGLLDQMAAAVGGIVCIDFSCRECPEVKALDFSLDKIGYSLCVVNTGGSHSDLAEDYAAVPGEMRAVARELSREVLSGIPEAELISRIPELRKKLGDRAVLRALHFVRECDRAEQFARAAELGSIELMLRMMLESGRSSFQYLQNIYSPEHPREQGISLALILADGYLSGSKSAFRVQGGGFAGTVEALMPRELVPGFVKLLDGVFGEGATSVLGLRKLGAVRIL